MKSSGIISFILMLIMGLVTFFVGMNMEAVLKSATPIILFSCINIIFSIVIFIKSSKVTDERGAKEVSKISIAMIVVAIIGLGFVSVSSGSDSELHRGLMDKNDLALKLFFMMFFVQLIVGIINIILGFKYKNDSDIKQDQPLKVVDTDITDKIKKLSDLKQQGILTEEEFTKKKTELLEKI